MLITKSVSLSRPGLIALLALSTLNVVAKAEETVLVPGRPPLTATVTDKTAAFFEWALDLRFTPDQAGEYRAMIVRAWSTPQKRKSTLEFLPVIDKLWASPPETRERVKAPISQALLESLNNNREDEQARWLLAIYHSSHGKPASQPVAYNSDDSGVRALAGKWRATSAAATQYKNSYTGAPAPTSGNSFFYQFLPEGTYQSNNLMQITTYGCTSSVYSESSGRFHVDGHHLYIEPARGTVKSQVCGGRPSEKPDSLAVREYVFGIEMNGGRETLVINGLDGKTRPDYYRREAQ